MLQLLGTFAYQPDEVSRGERERVGTGDDAGAGGVELGLDGVHHLVPADAPVQRCVLLGGVAGGGVEQDGALAAIHEAVEGEEAEPGFKISAKFRPNFTKFGNFGGDRKKTPNFFNTLVHVLYNSNFIFFYCLYCIFFYLIDM